MPEPFDLENPESAEKYLQALPRESHKRGEDYFRRGRVQSLEPVAPGSAYKAAVQGSELYAVHLFVDDGKWGADCTCPLGTSCKHCYAAMKALLAEYNVVRVQRLSASPARGRDQRNTARAKPASLDELLSASLQRPLEPSEVKFVAKVEALFERCRQRRQVMGWDLNELGLRAPGQSWDPLPLWPSVPATAHEFWQYVAMAAADWGQSIPEFMQPVSDLGEVRARVKRWRQHQEIQRWEKELRLLQAKPAASRTEVDLRLCFDATGAITEWKRSEREPFTVLKQTPARQLTEDWAQDRVTFVAEAEALWQVLQPRIYYHHGTEFKYHDSEAKKLLSRLLRLTPLRERLVTPQGKPLSWASGALHWDLQMEEGDDEYTLRLLQQDGTPLPPVIAALPGSPGWIITADTVFAAPVTVDAVRLDGKGTRIPAKALETPGGLDLLRRLNIEPPAAMRERIRIVPVKIQLRCGIQESTPGSKSEQCVVHLMAKSENGRIEERWTGERWVQDAPVETPYGTLTVVPRTPKRPKNEGDVYYDRSAQADAPRLLDALGLRWDAWRGYGYVRLTRKFPDVFVPWLKSLPAHIQVELEGELATLAHTPVSGEVKLDVVEAGIDWFDLRVVLNVSDTELTQEELKLLLDARGGYVRLAGKGWRRLQFNLSEEEDERLARLGLSPRELSSEPQRLHALQLADSAAKRFLPEAQFEAVQRRASEITARVTPDVPASVQAEMRPYQREGFHFLAYLSTNHFGGILADDMGLGKTLQTLAWLAWLREQPRSKRADRVPPSLVVCPKSVTDNWRAEAARFTPGLRVKVWGSGEVNGLLNQLAEADLHVINYAQLRTLGENMTPAQWLAVILDEGQYIKNPGSQTAIVARLLKAEHRLILTGTPIENRLLDLWSLMSFAMPGALGSRAQFGRLFDSKEDPFARRRLAARVRPFLLRRTKSQVAKDLPDRIEEDLFCEIEGEQKTLYRAELKRAQQILLKLKTQKQLNDERFNLLSSLLRLRQICCHPRLVQNHCKAPSAKVEALLEQLEPLMEEGQKVLVFSQFVTMLDLIKDSLKERGWPQFYLAGDTENRGELVQRFQAAEGNAVFLISLKAGGFGLNLTAASYVVLFDPWWNPAVENQAIDRTHRIGQTRKVIAYRLLIKDSIEEKIRALQKQKNILAEDVLGEEKFSQGLTLDDLRFLFAD